MLIKLKILFIKTFLWYLADNSSYKSKFKRTTIHTILNANIHTMKYSNKHQSANQEPGEEVRCGRGGSHLCQAAQGNLSHVA
jgi:hypothetical protein